MPEKYILMNRSSAAAALTIDSADYDHCIKSIEIIDLNKTPFPVRYCVDPEQPQTMESWIYRRLISPNRYGLEKILDLTKANRLESSLMAYGLSLTDGFWFKPENDNSIQWSDINFFSHSFSYDIGNVAFGLNTEHCDFLTPDLTTNGRMEKTWRSRNNTTWLLKKGSPPYYEEPFNEKAVSTIMQKISKVPFVKYDVIFIRRYAVSICENFTKEGIEFVSAADLSKTAPKPSYIDTERHLRERCKFFKIPGYIEFLNELKIIDFITGNMDRHLGNYGFLYDSDADKFIGPAPIYDNGSSLWFNEPAENITESINVTRQTAKRLAATIKHPEKYLLPKNIIPELKELISNTYADSGLYSDRAVPIETLLSQRYESLSEYLEIELEKSLQTDEVLLKFAKQKMRESHGLQEVSAYE